MKCILLYSLVLDLKAINRSPMVKGKKMELEEIRFRSNSKDQVSNICRTHYV